jgi:hypothetical protein
VKKEKAMPYFKEHLPRRTDIKLCGPPSGMPASGTEIEPEIPEYEAGKVTTRTRSIVRRR